MKPRGEVVSEIGTMLRAIAKRIESGEATSRDAQALERLARQAEGIDREFSIKVHGKRGRRPKGRMGVDQQFDLACQVKAHREKFGVTVDDACRILDGTHNVGEESIRKAWQAMKPLMNMEKPQQDMMLFFMRFSSSSDNAPPR